MKILQILSSKDFIEYSTPYGPTTPLTSLTLLEIFFLFFTRDILELIVAETNRHAYSCLANQTWEEITINELLAYFGFMILMGLVHSPSITDYWSMDPVFHYQPIAGRISRKKFLDIHRFLHFVNNTHLPAYGTDGYSRLQKVKRVLDLINDRFFELFTPGCCQSIDEGMVKFKGRSAIKQYMPNKPIRRGFKIWMRADAESGYVCQFDVYKGKDGKKTEKGLGGNVVMKLTQHIHGHYHHIFIDNYFNSIDLLVDLLKNKTYACGTIRKDRVGFPSTFKTIAKKGLANRGDSKSVQHSNLIVTIWQDTKVVTMASTNCQPNATGNVKRKTKTGGIVTVPCPKSIITYNQNMGGVDFNDQLRGYYSIRLKSRKFYKYLFWSVFDIGLTNMFIVCKKFTELGYNNAKSFRTALAKELIGDYNSRKRRGRKCSQPPTKQFCQYHFPIKDEKKGHRCQYCLDQKRTRQTSWKCEDCDIYLCHTGKEDDCFRKFHLKQ